HLGHLQLTEKGTIGAAIAAVSGGGTGQAPETFWEIDGRSRWQNPCRTRGLIRIAVKPRLLWMGFSISGFDLCVDFRSDGGLGRWGGHHRFITAWCQYGGFVVPKWQFCPSGICSVSKWQFVSAVLIFSV